MNRLSRTLLLALLGALAWCGTARSENWPQFRGPRGDGTSHEAQVPVRWSATENVRWKTVIPGEGHSSPIVWERSVFVTSHLPETHQRLLLRLDADSGEVLWKRVVVAVEKESMHRENSSASSTPVTDGELIVTSFQAGNRVDLRAFTFDGRERWAAQPLRFDGEHGYCYSPILHGDLLLFDCRQEGEAAVLGLDKRTGLVRWRAEPGFKRISHVPPLLIADGSRRQLIVCGSREIRSFDPETGRPIWWCDGPSDVAVAGLTYGEGLLFANAGYPERTRMAVRVSGKGNVTASHVAWSLRREASYVPSPVYDRGHFYSLLDEGRVYCFEAKTGRAVWDHRLGGRFRASLILAAGRIYATDDQGLTTVFAASPHGFQSLAANPLRESSYATPALSSGRIYLRTAEHLYCIEDKPSPQP